MKKKLLNTRKKRNLFAVALLIVLGLVGLTFAYFSTTSTFKNLFKVEPFNTTVYEVFESPESWTPGTTTPKEVYATNNSKFNVGVRVSYEEKWVAADGTELPLFQDGNKAAIINLSNLDEWEESNGYYYYYKLLEPNETTSSFMESVTFNPQVVGTYTCTRVDNVDTCESTGTGYDGATYTLTIKVEMYQDGYEIDDYVCPNPDTYPGEDLVIDYLENNVYSNETFSMTINTNNNTASIVEYIGAEGSEVDITIPKSLNGVPITTIDSSVFENKTLGELTISPNITTLGGVFKNTTLNKLNLDYATNITTIETNTLTTTEEIIVACSPNLTTLGYSTINTPKLTIKNLENLNDFKNIYSSTIDEIYMEGLPNLKTIGNNSSSNVFKKLTIKDSGVETISSSAFYSVPLQELYLVELDNLKTIESHAFARNNLNNLTLENLPSLENIYSYSFNFSSMGDITLRNLPKLTTIKEYTFESNTNESGIVVTLEDLPVLETIERYAFSEASINSLNINVPSLKTIGSNAFVDNNITHVDFEGMPNVETVESWAFGLNNLTEVDLRAAKKLTTIGGYAFAQANNLSYEGPGFSYINLSGLSQDIDYTDAFYNVTSVDVLDLSGVQDDYMIRSIIDRPNEINRLKLTNSGITSLYIGSEPVKETIDVTGCEDLTQIQVFSKGFDKLDLTGVSNLEYLELSSTSVKELDLSDLDKLKTIYIRSNSNMTKIKFGENPLITSLDGNIVGNAITEFDFSPLKNLTTLDIYGEPFTKIRIPATVTTLEGVHSDATLECAEILGDSTRFDSNFQQIFGVTKETLATTCTFG